MKSAIRLALLAGVTLAALTAAEVRLIQPGGLTVHEWGTFTSVAGEDGTAVEWDALGCSSDLPLFVNDYGYRGRKFRLTGTVRMETPVMYFYSSQEVDAHVKVSFPHGIITEWYPKADYQIVQKNALDGSTKRVTGGDLLIYTDPALLNLTGTLEWSGIKVQPGASFALPVESAPSRYYAARGTDAAPVTVDDQHEKFLFYRGVGRFSIPLSARLSDYGRVAVENRGQDPVPGVILFENHEGRIGYRTAHTAVEGAHTFETPLPGASLDQLRKDLETILVAEGLYPKEAHAMVETWRDSWFEEGSRLIYIVPSSNVDAILPLQVEPAPVKTVRVFVGRIELVTPETQRSVESAIARNDWATVDWYNRFLSPILKRIFVGNPSRLNQVEADYRKFQQSTGAANCR
jgi:hypothetical protein